jgi:hypothetical protein
MEMQQMMERLLVKMDANQAKMKANRKANQAKAEDGRKELNVMMNAIKEEIWPKENEIHSRGLPREYGSMHSKQEE